MNIVKGPHVSKILDWLERRREACAMKVERVGLGKLEGWTVDRGNGDLHHKTGGFFRITGIQVKEAREREVPCWCQPIIDQKEVGVLGLLVRQTSDETVCLVQAKAEPGNIGRILLAPTVQSTASNLKRLHGGAKSAFAEYFENPDPATVVYAVRQTEAGGRFLEASNLNIVVRAPADLESRGIPDYFMWVALGDLKALLGHEYVVNPYLRSLIACLWTIVL